MSYALFAQRKLELTGLLNGLQLQQTQRANEQLSLATNTLSLQQQLTSLQTAQSSELAQKYEQLAEAGDKFVQIRSENGECRGYMDIDYATNEKNTETGFNSEKGYVIDNDFNEDAGPVIENGKVVSVGVNKYSDLLKDEREKVQYEIKQLEQKFKREEDVINRQIYQVSIKENAIEMEVKRLDTKITAIQKQLEAVEEAEGAGIDRATPKFNGIG